MRSTSKTHYCKDRAPRQSKMRKALVMFGWSIIVFMMLLNKEKVGVETVDVYVNNNLQMIATNVWYGMVATASFLVCFILRIVMKTINYDEAGSILAMTFNTALAITISLNLNEVSFKTPNTPIDEMILCAIAGYSLYEMFFLRFVDSLTDKYKALGTVALAFFIVNCLSQSKGASVLLTYIFILSCPITILKLPAFASAKYVGSVAYKCSVWSAYVFAAYHRLIVGLGQTMKLSEVSEFRFDDFSMPIWSAIYCASCGVTCFMLEIINKMHQQRLKKEVKCENLKKEDVRSMVVYKRKVVQAYV